MTNQQPNPELQQNNEPIQPSYDDSLSRLKIEVTPEYLKEKNIDILIDMLNEIDKNNTSIEAKKSDLIQETLAKKLMDDPSRMSYVKSKLKNDTFVYLVEQYLFPESVQNDIATLAKKKIEEIKKSNINLQGDEKLIYYTAAVQTLCKSLGKSKQNVEMILVNYYGSKQLAENFFVRYYEQGGMDAVGAFKKARAEVKNAFGNTVEFSKKYGKKAGGVGVDAFDGMLDKGIPGVTDAILDGVGGGKISKEQKQIRGKLATIGTVIYAGRKFLKWIFSGKDKDGKGMGFLGKVGSLVAADFGYNAFTGHHLHQLLGGMISGGLDRSYVPFMSGDSQSASSESISNGEKTQVQKAAEKSSSNELYYIDVNAVQGLFGNYKIGDLQRAGVLSQKNGALKFNYTNAINFFKSNKNKNSLDLLTALKASNSQDVVEFFILNGFAKFGINNSTISAHSGENIKTLAQKSIENRTAYEAEKKQRLEKSKIYTDTFEMKGLDQNDSMLQTIKNQIQSNQAAIDKLIKEYENMKITEDTLKIELKKLLGTYYDDLDAYPGTFGKGTSSQSASPTSNPSQGGGIPLGI